jgi:hypothetical protein
LNIRQKVFYMLQMSRNSYQQKSASPIESTFGADEALDGLQKLWQFGRDMRRLVWQLWTVTSLVCARDGRGSRVAGSTAACMI